MTAPAGLLLALPFYGIAFAAALLVWPIARTVLPRAPDGAWTLARLAGPLLIGWIGWWVAATGLLPWGPQALAAGAMGVVLVAGTILVHAAERRRPVRIRVRRWLGTVAPAELVYAAAFAGVLTVRAVKPEIEGLEKFMNWAFVNAFLKADVLPPIDPWFAGEPINYYYFGHLVTAGLVETSGVPSAVGYNLAFAHTFAAFAMSVSTAVRWLVAAGFPGRRALAASAGALAAALALTAGNPHAVLFGLVRPALIDAGLISAGGEAYWFTQSSRLIGYQPDTTDKTIAEFPAYSVVVGDLHAHVLALPATGAALLVVLAVLLSRTPPSVLLRGGATGRRRQAALAQTGAFTLFVGWGAVTNTWDVPVLLMLLGLAAVSAERRAGRGWIGAGLVGALAATAVLPPALLAGLPFWVHFESFSQGVLLPRHGSPLWQWLLLHGHHVAIAAAFALAVLPAALRLPPGSRQRAALGVAVLFAHALLLLQVPEAVSVRDIYGETYERANTMFKLGYQAAAVFSVASVAGAVLLVAAGRGASGRAAAALFAGVTLVAPVAFFAIAWGQFLAPREGRIVTLDGSLFLSHAGSGDIFVVAYLNEAPPRRDEIILEASGDSYTRAGRISAATGIPTVLGWHVHEWLWRVDPGLWQRRAAAVADFYQTTDDAARRRLAEDFRIRYVVVGDVERQRYPNLDEPGLRALGPAVVDDGLGTMLIDLAPQAGGG